MFFLFQLCLAQEETNSFSHPNVFFQIKDHSIVFHKSNGDERWHEYHLAGKDLLPSPSFGFEFKNSLSLNPPFSDSAEQGLLGLPEIIDPSSLVLNWPVANGNFYLQAVATGLEMIIECENFQFDLSGLKLKTLNNMDSSDENWQCACFQIIGEESLFIPCSIKMLGPWMYPSIYQDQLLNQKYWIHLFQK